MVLEEAALGTSSHRTNKRAPALVPFPDRTLHCGRDVAIRGVMRCSARPTDGCMSRLAQVRQQQRQCPLEDERDVSIRDSVSEQLLCFAEHLMGFP